jgi:hypothetical protein
MNANTQESRKMAAAIAAVFGYIRNQEDASAGMVPMAAPAVEPPTIAVPARMWGMSGRQEMMSLRNLMQLRTFQGSKLR